jgi:hypothetical protein
VSAPWRRLAALLAAALVALWPAPARAQRLCVEGASVHGAGFDRELIETLARNAVTCVHVRMRQDLWAGPDDPTRRGDPPRTLFEAWDALIDFYRARGIDVILEVGADAVGRPMHELRDPAARARYAAFLVRVVARPTRPRPRASRAPRRSAPRTTPPSPSPRGRRSSATCPGRSATATSSCSAGSASNSGARASRSTSAGCTPPGSARTARRASGRPTGRAPGASPST